MGKYQRITLALVSLLLLVTELSSQITLPKVFGDNMVLQRGIQIPIWGNATPGIRLIAELGSVRTTTIANQQGKWQIHFPKQKTGGPFKLRIYEVGKPDSGIELKNILIGDVWVASGQSNMEWQVQQAKDAKVEIAQANYPQIRFLFVEHDKKLSPQNNIKSGKWAVCDTTNVKQFSAVAYYFARKIHHDQHVPVGIIQSTWGGTPVESWTSREQLLTSPISRPATLANDTLSENDFVTDSLNLIRFWDIAYHPKNNTEKEIPQPQFDDSGWKTLNMPRVIRDMAIYPYSGMVWLRKTIRLPESFTGKELTLNLGHPEMNYTLYFNGTEICKNVWNANKTHAYTIPNDIVKSGENTIAIRMAMLWGGGGFNPPAEDIYLTNGQGKISLTGEWRYKEGLEPALPEIRNYHYYPSVLFNAMINPLIPFGIKGFLWYQGEANDTAAYNYRTQFPLMINDWRNRWKQGRLPFLFVQLANYKKTTEEPGESEWAELRESQALALKRPVTGMACTIDIGDGETIHPLNKQEVGRRLALIANNQVYHHQGVASGPVFDSFKGDGGSIRIRFKETGSGLRTKDGKAITGFAIAGNDRKFYWANARIEGTEVVVNSANVPNPVVVRYAWADNPECNLVNSEGLPAIPFRTDNWKLKTEKSLPQ